MGDEKYFNKPCKCGSGKKWEKCCKDKIKILGPVLTGNQAEDFVEKLSQNAFLHPWVFKAPKYISDNKEFSDVAILFKKSLILIEVKGNQFDPKNPQRYLKYAKDRHQQLITARRVAETHKKKVKFKNDYYDFETDFTDIDKIYLVSMSGGRGEMVLAFDSSEIDHSNIDYQETSKYLGFFNSDDNIHCFTTDEFLSSSKYIDTIKEFLWYLDFEVKYFNGEFETYTKSRILSFLETDRLDLVATFIRHYADDINLNKNGLIMLDKLIEGTEDVEGGFIVCDVTGASEYLRSKEYEEYLNKQKISYSWDKFITEAIFQAQDNYMIKSGDHTEHPVSKNDLFESAEALSYTTRPERTAFCEKINAINTKGSGGANMFSDTYLSETVFSYSIINYEEKPSIETEKIYLSQRLLSIWCKVIFSKDYDERRDKMKKVMSITHQKYKNESKHSFVFSTKLSLDRELCDKICEII